MAQSPSQRVGGGTSLEVLTRITLLEQELSALKQSIATDAQYGLAKVTNAMDVTDEKGIALSAVQNNASIPGTLANRVEKITGGINLHFVTSALNFTDGYTFLNLDKEPYGNFCITQLAGGNWRDFAISTSYPAGNRIFIMLTSKISGTITVNAVYATKG